LYKQELASFPGVDFTNIFGTKAEQLLRRYFFMLLRATTIGKNVPKYSSQYSICSLKYAMKFHKNVGETEQHLLRH
jgi:hypothetical protein